MAHLAVLAKIRGLSAIGASTVAEARAMIQEASPQVVVLDMRLPDGTGMDVIAALEAAKANAVVIVASAYLEDYRTKLPRSERIHLLGKPVPMHELRRIVEASMSNTNILGPFTVIDYVQLACMGHHSAIIECVGSAGRGEIIIERGELWSAADPQGNGLPAFERLLLSRKASAKQLGEQYVRVPRNLHDRWELLILDA
ncbi:MAG TPA: response regulator, partial [Pseudomonadota bacterium]|nr:response regulator [Pseudomonadota bacterium]